MSKWRQPWGRAGDGALLAPVGKWDLPEKCHRFAAPWFSVKSLWILEPVTHPKARLAGASVGVSRQDWTSRQRSFLLLAICVTKPRWLISFSVSHQSRFAEVTSAAVLCRFCGGKCSASWSVVLSELIVTYEHIQPSFFDKVIKKQMKLTLKMHFWAVKILDKFRFFFNGFHQLFSRIKEKLR